MNFKALAEITFKQIIQRSFIRTYAPDGYSRVTQLYKGNSISIAGEDAEFLYDPLTGIATFFGLPNYDRGHGQSVTNILKNIAHWEDPAVEKDKPFRRIAKNIGAMFFFVPVHLLLAVPQTALNTLKLGTEMLPTMIVLLCAKAVGKTMKSNVVLKKIARGSFEVAKVFAGLGKALTSPLTLIRQVFYRGKRDVENAREKFEAVKNKNNEDVQYKKAEEKLRNSKRAALTHGLEVAASLVAVSPLLPIMVASEAVSATVRIAKNPSGFFARQKKMESQVVDMEDTNVVENDEISEPASPRIG